MQTVLSAAEAIVDDEYEGERPLIPDSVYCAIVGGACFVIAAIAGLIACAMSWL